MEGIPSQVLVVCCDNCILMLKSTFAIRYNFVLYHIMAHHNISYHITLHLFNLSNPHYTILHHTQHRLLDAVLFSQSNWRKKKNYVAATNLEKLKEDQDIFARSKGVSTYTIISFLIFILFIDVGIMPLLLISSFQ